MKIILIIIILSAIAIVIYWVLRKKKKSNPIFELDSGDKVFISASSQSDKRVKDLGLDKKTFDASQLLDIKKLHLIENIEEDRDYQPNAAVDWIIDIDTSDRSVNKDLLWKAFADQEWRKNYPGTELYGFSKEENRWTYVIAGDSPEHFTKLQFGCHYLNRLEETSAIEDSRMNHYLLGIENRFKKFGLSVQIIPQISPTEATKRAKRIRLIAEDLDREVIVVLRSEERPFNLKKCWQALTNLGLRWGDGDLFHWNNEESGDVFFSVWTSTSPGYFLPEQVAQNKYAVEDLVFGFSIPRSQDPANVLLVMLDCINYCNKELGGYILNRYGKRADIADLKNYVRECVEELNANNIQPGSEEALRLF